VGLSIFYHDPEQIDRAGLTIVLSQSDAADVVARLEACGFVVDKITFTPPRQIGARPAARP
jgi:hypothetical protein